MIETPYLPFLGDAPDMLAAKVAIGIRDWRPEFALGQLRLPGCGADPGLPEMTLAEAKAAGVRTVMVADFMAGAVEWLTPNNEPDHWDLIEGQGSLFHVSYSGVTLALIHDGQPDALILCHEPTRSHIRGLPGHALRSLEELRDMALPLARIANPACQVAGISINTQHMTEAQACLYLAEVEAEMGLPATDPYRFGAQKLVDALAAM